MGPGRARSNASYARPLSVGLTASVARWAASSRLEAPETLPARELLDERDRVEVAEGVVAKPCIRVITRP